ncbi:Uncharacterized protein TCM_043662 [Theobroma cacao]|uniref:Reverse transcriptase domain-containing protein n=1 Tax=Theobroma cacao TaxID=3641 RepID=A0A061FNX9_THECC|nr:Uncharacterized protein TCM_043662 [Theobroma cacao]
MATGRLPDPLISSLQIGSSPSLQPRPMHLTAEAKSHASLVNNDGSQAFDLQNQPPTSLRFQRKSFLSIAKGEKPPMIPLNQDPVVYKDQPAAAFFEDEIRTLVEPFNLCLHWFIANQKMWVFKWYPDFEAEKESLVVPVWISFSNLKAHLYKKLALLLIAKTIGKPLFVNKAIAKGSRPNVARVCVEYDCKKPLTDPVWIVIQNRDTSMVTSSYSQKGRKNECKISSKNRGKQIEFNVKEDGRGMGNEVLHDNEEQPVALEKVATLTTKPTGSDGVLQESLNVHREWSLSKKGIDEKETVFSELVGLETFHKKKKKLVVRSLESTVNGDGPNRSDGQRMVMVSTSLSDDLVEGSEENMPLVDEEMNQLGRSKALSSYGFLLFGIVHNDEGSKQGEDDKLETEHSGGNILAASTTTCIRESMQGRYANRSNSDRGMGKYLFNKELSDIPSHEGMCYGELEVHPLVIWVEPHDGAMEDFATALLDYDLIDGGFQGYLFTWINNRAALPKGITSATLVLLPKNNHASKWSEYRPISLCNVLNKIITKILAIRLTKVLPSIILGNQSGFVGGRLINDNILLAQELIGKIDKKARGGNVVLKLDMMKAYDQLD